MKKKWIRIVLGKDELTSEELQGILQWLVGMPPDALVRVRSSDIHTTPEWWTVQWDHFIINIERDD